MKDQKAALIDAIYDQLASNERAKEQFKKEFKLDDKAFEKIAKKLLDMWLNSPEIIMLLSEMFGVYAEEGMPEDEEDDQDYLG